MKRLLKALRNCITPERFALTEVLITLAIIGVVAALTIPTLVAISLKAAQ